MVTSLWLRYSARLLLFLCALSTLSLVPDKAWTAPLLQDEIVMPTGQAGVTTGVQLANLQSSPVVVTLKAINATGAIIRQFDDTIAANSSKTYFPVEAIGIGSVPATAIVFAPQGNIAAIANVLAKSPTGVNVGASYSYPTTRAAAAFLPLIMKNNGKLHFNTQFTVINTTATTITTDIAYTPINAQSGNSGCHQAATIGPRGSVTFDQRLDTNFTGCTGGLEGDDGKFVGSAKVTATGNIVVPVLEINDNTMFAYTGFAQGTPNPIFPLINFNSNGTVTGIQIGNLGATDTDVMVAYTSTGPAALCTETQTVKAGSSATFALAAFTNSAAGATENCPDDARMVGSARVTANSANQPLVAIVNQLNNSKGFGAAYNAFTPATATNKVSLPLLLDNNGAFKAFTGYSIVNVGSAATDITCTYAAVGGHTPAAATATNIAQDTAMVVVNNGQLRKDNNISYVGSANCVATPTGSKIVGVVNQSVALLTNPNNGVSAGDKLLVYEGFNAP